MPTSRKRHAPATLRNREPILEVLSRVLPERGSVLEIASGTGEHAVFFADKLPGVVWQPSDVDPENLESIEAWRRDSGLANVLPPIRLDVLQEKWPVDQVDAVFCANMIHIAPWEATEALMTGTSRVLVDGGPLVLYGPFREGDRHVSESNRVFDERLRSQNPAWGVRDRLEVERLALDAGLRLREIVTMPANNRILVFTR